MKHGEATPHYREVLGQELEARSTRNRSYSLRSFARDLSLSPQRLSDLIRGRYGLSALQATAIADSLGIVGAQRTQFIESADMHHARSKQKRERAAAAYAAATEGSYSQLSLDSFQVISDWYHYAILELTATKNFKSEPAAIAKKLDISTFTAQKAIARLLRLGLLTRTKAGKLAAREDFTASPNGVPSDAIKKFHKQILEKAMQAIDMQSLHERDHSSMILAVKKNSIESAKAELKDFRRKFAQKYGTGPEQDEVYCLSLQFFRLQTKSEEK